MTYKKILIPIAIIVTAILIVVSIIIIGNINQKKDSNIVEDEKIEYITEIDANLETKIDSITNEDNTNTSGATMKAVIIKAQEDYLYVMDRSNQNSLLKLNLKNFNYDGFKMRQEILVYYDGYVLESYPGQVNNIEKIEITNEESNIQIPDRYLRFCYSSGDNVEISISEITNNGIDIIIKDTNDLQYIYSNHYIIQKQVRNDNYTGISQTIGENTANSIAPSTRNRIRIYL